jgi:glycosyltransferase involved in cell wall biosynthesis
MYKNKSIAVVVPAYNEETQIGRVIETMPDYVDKIVIIDDKSLDNTIKIVEEYGKGNDKIILVCHERNLGVGGAIASGYKWARDHEFDVAVVMAGDGQMSPGDLPVIIDPIVEGKADYSKGNRLFTGEAYKRIPKVRYFGNAVLSLLTKISSGYWHVADSQSGFTAINKEALSTIDWDKMYKGYGQPNDLLVRLNVSDYRAIDVHIRPVYNIGERSGIKLKKVVFTISWLLLKLFLWRIKEKYIIRDFHPLVFFYFLGFLLLGLSCFFFLQLVYLWIKMGYAPLLSAIAWMFSFATGLQTTFFAMWFDMEYNKDLRND